MEKKVRHDQRSLDIARVSSIHGRRASRAQEHPVRRGDRRALLQRSGADVFTAILAMFGHLLAQFNVIIFVLSWMAYKRAKQAHDLNVVLLWIFLGQVVQCVNSAQANREHVAPEHLGTLLVAFVQQSPLRRVGLFAVLPWPAGPPPGCARQRPTAQPGRQAQGRRCGRARCEIRPCSANRTPRTRDADGDTDGPCEQDVVEGSLDPSADARRRPADVGGPCAQRRLHPAHEYALPGACE